MNKAKQKFSELKPWWNRSLYGYKERTKDQLLLAFERNSNVSPFYHEYPPKWWGKIIVRVWGGIGWSFEPKRIAAFIAALLVAIPVWAPSIPKKVDSLIQSFFGWTDPPNDDPVKDKSSSVKDSGLDDPGIISSDPSATVVVDVPKNIPTHPSPHNYQNPGK